MSGVSTLSRDRTVGIAENPVANGELGRIWTHGADATDGTAPRHNRQFQKIFSLAAEYLARIGQDRRGYDIDDHFSGTADRIRHVFKTQL